MVVGILFSLNSYATGGDFFVVELSGNAPLSGRVVENPDGLDCPPDFTITRKLLHCDADNPKRCSSDIGVSEVAFANDVAPAIGTIIVKTGEVSLCNNNLTLFYDKEP